MLYNTLHNIDTIANKDPQKALAKLVKLDKDDKIQLDLTLTDATNRGGTLINHEILPLREIQHHWEFEKNFDKAHKNNGMVSQDKTILQAVDSYAKEHSMNEWTNLDLDFNNNVYTLKPIDKYVISDIIFTILNKQDY